MNKTEKIIVSIYLSLAILYCTYAIYEEKQFSSLEFPNHSINAINEIVFTKTVDVNKTKLFETISNIQNYPLILPGEVISVKIINQTNNEIYANEEFFISFTRANLVLKYDLVRYDNLTIEALNSDAKGTVIVDTFEGNDSYAKVTTDLKLHVNGKLTPLEYLPKSLVQSQLDNTLTSFIDYAKGFDNKYEKIVDDMYREILYRPADPQGLVYYSSQLQSGKMTVDDIRKTLTNSDEGRFALKPSERKTPDELSDKTRQIINALYTEILDRPADPLGMSYFGSELEAGKITVDDIEQKISQSDEARSHLKPSQWKTVDELNKTTIEIVNETFINSTGRQPTPEALSYFGSELESDKMSVADMEKILINSK